MNYEITWGLLASAIPTALFLGAFILKAVPVIIIPGITELFSKPCQKPDIKLQATGLQELEDSMRKAAEAFKKIGR